MNNKDLKNNKYYELQISRNPQFHLSNNLRKGINTTSTQYWPGCGNRIMHKLIDECMDKLGI